MNSADDDAQIELSERLFGSFLRGGGLRRIGGTARSRQSEEGDHLYVPRHSCVIDGFVTPREATARGCGRACL
ncbi:hypothetical protein ACIOG8_37500 [Streptomyces erythrochromogenes]|uniref:hypothetical protein n=1 Tax=Streptomyces erythrochromogenes TaxID=285574 RepID=UPI003823AEEC